MFSGGVPKCRPGINDSTGPRGGGAHVSTKIYAVRHLDYLQNRCAKPGDDPSRVYNIFTHSHLKIRRGWQNGNKGVLTQGKMRPPDISLKRLCKNSWSIHKTVTARRQKLWLLGNTPEGTQIHISPPKKTPGPIDGSQKFNRKICPSQNWAQSDPSILGPFDN